MEYVMQPARKVPIYARGDVLVIGGGAAGLSAAVACARLGCKTILIEEGGCLGGTLTLSTVPGFMAVFPSVNKGYFAEFCQRLAEREALAEGFYSIVNLEAFKSLSFDIIEEEGIELLLHTTAVDVIRDQSRLSGILSSNSSGLQAIMGDVIIDASGDANVALMAGEEFDEVRIQGDEQVQAMTLVLRVGNIDLDRFKAFVKSYPDEEEFSYGLGPTIISGFSGLLKEARRKGESNLPPRIIMGFSKDLLGNDMMLIHATHVTGLDPTDGRQLTLAEIEGRKQMMSAYSFLKRSIPGFEDSFICDTGPYIGIRESRRILGEYVLTYEDIKESRHFDDSIAMNFSPVDIHGPGEEQQWITLGSPYQIPYRSLLARANENLLVAGRCISTDHVAHGSTRMVPCCFATGQAAGVSAALSVLSRRSLKGIDIDRLQSELRKQGAVIFLDAE